MWDDPYPCFGLHFPPSHAPVSHLYLIVGKMSVQTLCPFFNQIVCFLLLSCVSSIYTLDIKSLSDVWFTDILSSSVGCLFILLKVLFVVYKFFSLTLSYLFIFVFVTFVSVSDLELIAIVSRSVITCFSLRVLWFQVLRLNL